MAADLDSQRSYIFIVKKRVNYDKIYIYIFLGELTVFFLFNILFFLFNKPSKIAADLDSQWSYTFIVKKIAVLTCFSIEKS